MYTLQKAKEEIDAVAKHATDIAVHSIAVAAEVDAKLERFKTDILSAIEEKFAEFSRSIRGDEEPAESTAISDLGAKVSLLTQPAAPAAPGESEHTGKSEHSNESDHGHQDDAPPQDNNWNHDQHNEHHHHD